MNRLLQTLTPSRWDERYVDLVKSLREPLHQISRQYAAPMARLRHRDSADEPLRDLRVEIDSGLGGEGDTPMRRTSGAVEWTARKAPGCKTVRRRAAGAWQRSKVATPDS